jgi:acetyl esterase/lipase
MNKVNKYLLISSMTGVGIASFVFGSDFFSESDPLKNALGDNIFKERNFNADFLTDKINNYSGPLSTSLQKCIVEDNNIYNTGKIKAPFNTDFKGTQSREDILEELNPVLGHAIFNSQINWIWDKYNYEYNFVTAKGDEKIWSCYFKNETNFFKNFLVIDHIKIEEATGLHGAPVYKEKLKDAMGTINNPSSSYENPIEKVEENINSNPTNIKDGKLPPEININNATIVDSNKTDIVNTINLPSTDLTSVKKDFPNLVSNFEKISDELKQMNLSLNSINLNSLSFSEKLRLDNFDLNNLRNNFLEVVKINPLVKKIYIKNISLQEVFKIDSVLQIIINDRKNSPEIFHSYRIHNIKKLSDLIEGHFLLKFRDPRSSTIERTNLNMKIFKESDLKGKQNYLYDKIKLDFNITLEKIDILNLSQEEKQLLLEMNLEADIKFFNNILLENGSEFIVSTISLYDVINFHKSVDVLKNAIKLERSIESPLPKKLTLQEFNELNFLSPSLQEKFNELSLSMAGLGVTVGELNINTLDEWGKYLIEETTFENIKSNYLFLQQYYGFKVIADDKHITPRGGLYISGYELIELDLKLRIFKQATESSLNKMDIPKTITLGALIEMKFLNHYSDEYYNYSSRSFRPEDYPFLKPYKVNGFYRKDGLPAGVDGYVNNKINENKKRPVVVKIHGGGWVSGDKKMAYGIYAPLLQKFVDDGSLVLAINYRLLQEKGQWVDQMTLRKEVEDIQEFFKELSEKKSIIVNGETIFIDKNNISVFGGSAGGHLSLMTSSFKDKEGNPIVKNIASIYPVAQNIDVVYKYAHSKGSIYYTVPSLRDGIMDRSGSEDDKNYISPMSHIQEVDKNTKIRLFHSLTDDQTPIIDSVKYYEKAKKQGLDVKASYSLHGNHGYNPGFVKNVQEKVYNFFSEQ